jgi:hypothetical protein
MVGVTSFQECKGVIAVHANMCVAIAVENHTHISSQGYCCTKIAARDTTCVLGPHSDFLHRTAAHDGEENQSRQRTNSTARPCTRQAANPNSKRS